MIDFETRHQGSQDLHFVVLGDQVEFGVVLARQTREGQVEQQHIEVLGQAFAGTGKGARGG